MLVITHGVITTRKHSMTAVTIFATATATAPVVMNDEIIVIVLWFAYFQTFDLDHIVAVAVAPDPRGAGVRLAKKSTDMPPLGMATSCWPGGFGRTIRPDPAPLIRLGLILMWVSLRNR